MPMHATSNSATHSLRRLAPQCPAFVYLYVGTSDRNLNNMYASLYELYSLPWF